MLSSIADEGWLLTVLIAVLTVALVAFALYRDHIRRKSLRKQDDGMYVWTEWHGGERTSRRDPSKPGGAWHNDADIDAGD